MRKGINVCVAREKGGVPLGNCCRRSAHGQAIGVSRPLAVPINEDPRFEIETQPLFRLITAPLL